MRHPASLLAIFCAYICALALAAQAFAGPPKRVVVAGGDLTEIVFALGEGAHVVGVDSTSSHPARTKDLGQIGYVRRLSAEGILSLSPDLVIAAHDAGPATALSQIEAAGVQVAQAPQAAALPDIVDKIRFVGDILDQEERAEALAEQFMDDLTDVADKVGKLVGTPRVLFIISLERGAPLVAGSGTQAETMITGAGGKNAATGFTGFKPMSQEAIIQAAPDAIVMMAQHAERFGGVEAILKRPDIALTPAGRNGRAFVMDGMLLLGFGPRTPEAIAGLARFFHPDDAERVGF
ncbi:MAG: ABC transporter substrate-binding protein [Pseudomonadota bacterium]